MVILSAFTYRHQKCTRWLIDGRQAITTVQLNDILQTISAYDRIQYMRPCFRYFTSYSTTGTYASMEIKNVFPCSSMCAIIGTCCVCCSMHTKSEVRRGMLPHLALGRGGSISAYRMAVVFCISSQSSSTVLRAQRWTATWAGPLRCKCNKFKRRGDARATGHHQRRNKLIFARTGLGIRKRLEVGVLRCCRRRKCLRHEPQ